MTSLRGRLEAAATESEFNASGLRSERDDPLSGTLARDFDRCAALLREAAAQLGEREWRDISEAPKDGTRILARWPTYSAPAWFETYWDHDTSQGDKPDWSAPGWNHLIDGYSPTHFMPLPSPPEST